MMEKQEQDTVIIRTKKRKIIEEERIRRSWTNSPQVTFCLKNYLEELHQQHTGQTKVCRVSNYKEEPTTSWQDCCQACQVGRQHGRFLITDLTDFKDCKEIPVGTSSPGCWQSTERFSSGNLKESSACLRHNSHATSLGNQIFSKDNLWTITHHSRFQCSDLIFSNFFSHSMIHGLVIEGAQAGLVVVRSLPLVVVVSRPLVVVGSWEKTDHRVAAPRAFHHSHRPEQWFDIDIPGPTVTPTLLEITKKLEL